MAAAPDLARSLTVLGALPGVPEKVEEAREACTRLRWHQALRRRIPQAAAESRVRGARASAALEGAELSVDLVRDVMRGAAPWPDQLDPVEQVARGAVQATAEVEQIAALVLSAPRQALARLHAAAAAGLLDPEQVGRPRQDGEVCRELTDLGEPLASALVPERLSGVVDLVLAASSAPAVVVSALVHAEIATVRPFVRGNGVVARAMERAVVGASGLDPTGVAVTEAGHGTQGGPAYLGALAAYGTGSPQGVALWLIHCCDALIAAATEGERIADAVLSGRLR